ncbi:MAG: hypothetical protein WBD50_07770 [Candidatus Rhabdochlamydia sp.]
MFITEKYILNSPTCILNKSELSIEFEQPMINAFCAINFLPLVKFIDEGNAEFEALLKADEVQQSITNNEQIPTSNKKLLSQRKKYSLRYKPYQTLQGESDLSLEHKKQQALDLIHSGVAKAVIEKKCGIRAETLKEWCKLSPWSGWKDRSQQR